MYEDETGNYYTVEESRKRSLQYDYDYGNYGNYVSEAKRYNDGGTNALLKLLIPNYAAGALLGQGGTILNELKSQYSCDIRLSPNKEHYPGTSERIVVITGDMYQIIQTNNHIMAKVQDPGRQLDVKTILEGRREMVKIILTEASLALLIGLNGNTIRGIQDESQANISFNMHDIASVPGERIVTVSGTMDQRIEACRQVIAIIALDSSNMKNTKIKYSTANARYMGTLYNSAKQPDSRAQFSVMSGVLQESDKTTERGIQSFQSGMEIPVDGASFSEVSDKDDKVKCVLKTKVDIQMDVPNSLTGGIFGPRGSIIRDIALRSGAKLRFSDYVATSPIRTLSITGDKAQTDAAFNLINQRVGQLGGIPPTDMESTENVEENPSNTDTSQEELSQDQSITAESTKRLPGNQSSENQSSEAKIK